MNKIRYASSDSEQESLENNKVVNAKPDALVPKVEFKIGDEISINLSYSELSKPKQGPMNPFVKESKRNMLSGYVEEHFMNDDAFYNLTRNFEKDGIESGAVVKPSKKRPKREKGNVEDETFKGPWAQFEGDIVTMPVRSEDEKYEVNPDYLFDKSKLQTGKEVKVKMAETSVLHGKQEYDYLGRSWTYPPNDTGTDLTAQPGGIENFIPKRLIHTWQGHTKSVNVIKYFPKTAHLILSGAMDNKVKIWDVYRERSVRRTYNGHSRGVKDATFNHNGEKFLSASYDKYVKLWDTETGNCISRFTSGSVPQCIVYHPDPSKHTFLAGCQDNKIYQFDIRSNDITLKYEQHTGMINSLTFIEENQRFVSTSDDKSMRCWEFGIPLVIKYVAEPDMQTITTVSLSQNRKWLACQCLDNRIMIVSALDKLRVNRKKLFTGHLIAGFQCKPNFSPDNRFIMSGDSEGMMWFWDWKTNKVLKKFKAHEGAISECLWHPHESSKVATASWDGTIKYWD